MYLEIIFNRRAHRFEALTTHERHAEIPDPQNPSQRKVAHKHLNLPLNINCDDEGLIYYSDIKRLVQSY